MSYGIVYAKTVYDGAREGSAVLGTIHDGDGFVSFTIDGRDFIVSADFAQRFGAAISDAAAAALRLDRSSPHG